MEVTTPVYTVMVRYTCDKCGGDVNKCDSVLTVHPPIYVMSCERCYTTYNMKKMYPYYENKEMR